ncbi:MAG: hypothetical protein OXU77_17700 [Gammaproteobacteria bacterium]|nr:hypothetical protein [Gammaproteobacteria bacterium]MDE0432664.1 hypothetical protein [Bryobacterales bacterium]
MTARPAKLVENTVYAALLLGLWCMVSMAPSWSGVLLLALAFWAFGTTVL